MTLPRGLVDETMATAIKVDLWAGHMTQEIIANKYNVSQPTISRIFRGRDWRQLPWPDGSLGHIPIERRNLIHASRHRHTRYQHDTRAGRSELDPKTSKAVDKVVDRLLAIEDEQLRELVSKKATEDHSRPKRQGDRRIKKFQGDMRT